MQLPPEPDSIKGRLSRVDGRIGVAGRAVLNILEEGETWVVISLVGELLIVYVDVGSRTMRNGSGGGQRLRGSELLTGDFA